MVRLPALVFTNVVIGLVVLSSGGPAKSEQLAFPGAEGFGRLTRGGRGGDVYHVLNLNDAGPGSLREGIRTANGPRTIVFDVSGTIELKTPLVVEKSFLTIAGQSAPGDGICLKDQTFRIKQASHVIVRYLRVRLGDKNKPRPSGPDCITTDDVNHLIFDHVTATWGIDGNHDLRRGGYVTIQWCIYAEALNDSLHEKGKHAMLASFRDLTASVSLHHNLMASSRERHPTLGGSPRTNPDALIDFRNNVVYNLSGATNLGNCRINLINNIYRPGPDTALRGKPLATKTENPASLKVYLSGNLFERQPEFIRDQYRAIDFDRWATGNYRKVSLDQVRADSAFKTDAAMPITDSVEDAWERVLRFAGASRKRDAADARLVAGIRDGSNRSIDSQDEVGGWPELKSEPAATDADRDGMPDDWERQHQLNPDDPRDGNLDRDQDGFTNLEEYLNSLCPPSELR